MSDWIGFDPVGRICDGAPDLNGYGAERLMKGLAGTVVERVVTCAGQYVMAWLAYPCSACPTARIARNKWRSWVTIWKGRHSTKAFTAWQAGN